MKDYSSIRNIEELRRARKEVSQQTEAARRRLESKYEKARTYYTVANLGMVAYRHILGAAGAGSLLLKGISIAKRWLSGTQPKDEPRREPDESTIQNQK